MLSVVLYGRNDSYGYNLHKRAAISLNALAELLIDPFDEIVFVDYNTGDDLPTFPEAIRDTLTAKTRSLLRIIRVRGDVHREARLDSPLVMCEPLARNIGVRRARPENRWVLSTNTDMVFVPRQGRSLSEIVAHLPDGYYALPRFEVPDTLWETVNRMEPRAVIEAFARWGDRFCLREVVHSKPYLPFDGPGDFQLFTAESMVAINGYDERMVYPWHIDSNLCKRMYLHFGGVGSLADHLLGYHCEHTRVTTPAHSSERVENSWVEFCENVTEAGVPDQAETWGRNGELFEEVSIATDRTAYEDALDAIYEGASCKDLESLYTAESYNANVFFDTKHAFPFVSNSLVTLPRKARIAYVGRNAVLEPMLDELMRRLGFGHGLVRRDPTRLGPLGGCMDLNEILDLADADVFVFDFSFPQEMDVQNKHGRRVLRFSAQSLSDSLGIMAAFLCLAQREQQLQNLGNAPRKFILLGVQNTHFEELTSHVVGLIAVPYSCHIRHGFVRPAVDIRTPLLAFQELLRIGADELRTVASAIIELAAKDESEHDYEHIYHEIDRLMLLTAADPERALGEPDGRYQRATLCLFVLALMMGRLGGAAMSQATCLRLFDLGSRRA